MNNRTRAMRAHDRTGAQVAAPAALAAVAAVAAIAPAQRGFVRGAFLAGLAGLVALLLAAAPDAAYAQARTLTVSATPDRDSTTPGVQVNEGDTVTITVTLDTAVASGAVVYGDILFGGTATQGEDYTTDTQLSGAHAFDGPSFTSSTTMDSDQITITDGSSDGGPEGDETITLMLGTPLLNSSPHTLTVTPTTLTITILGNDGNEFSIAADEASVAENVGNLAFTVSMIGEAPASGSNRTVDWAVTGVDTAADLVNYPSTRRLTFTSTGDMTITLMVNDDSLAEGDETLTVTLSNPSGGATLSTTATSASTVIEDDDAEHTFALTSPAATITEDDSDVSQTYTVTRTGPAIDSGTALTITWAVTVDGAAATDASAADFNGNALPTSTVRFTGSDTSETFTVVVEGDNLNEAGEEFTIEFSIASAHAADATTNGGAAPPANQTVTITDDDPIAVTVTASEGTADAAGVVTCATSSATTATVTEGRYACLNVDLGAIPTRAVRIVYNTEADTTSATDDVDATHTGAGTGPNDDLGRISNGAEIQIAANTNPPVGSMTVLVTDDNRNEAAETFLINTITSSIFGEHGTATVVGATAMGHGMGVATVFTIADNDDITYAIARADSTPATITEGQPARFEVTLSGAADGSAAQIMLPYTVTSSGTYNVAMSERSGTLTFAAGETSQPLNLALPRDATLGDSDPDQTLTVTLGAPADVTVGDGGGEVMRGTSSAQVTVNLVSADHIFTLSNPTLRVT